MRQVVITVRVGSCASWVSETAKTRIPATSSISDGHEMEAPLSEKMAISCGRASVSKKIVHWRMSFVKGFV